MGAPVNQRVPNEFECSFMHLPVEQFPNNNKEVAQVLNAAKIAGYVPGISIIVGIARIIFGALLPKNTDNDKKFRAAQILRGALEICTVFAPILLVIDLINTARFRHTPQNDAGAARREAQLAASDGGENAVAQTAAEKETDNMPGLETVAARDARNNREHLADEARTDATRAVTRAARRTAAGAAVHSLPQ